MLLELPTARDPKARTAELSGQFGTVEIVRPASRKASSGLPKTTTVNLIIPCEINTADSEEPAPWSLLTPIR